MKTKYKILLILLILTVNMFVFLPRNDKAYKFKRQSARLKITDAM